MRRHPFASWLARPRWLDIVRASYLISRHRETTVRNRLGALVRIAVGGGICLGGAAAAHAAETGAAPTEGLQEVIVTAQKRAENEQSVPLSITAFSAAALQQKAINDFFDYGTKVPNLGFAMTGDGVGTARTISIRGISGDNVTGFYIDDTPLPDSIATRSLMFMRRCSVSDGDGYSL